MRGLLQRVAMAADQDRLVRLGGERLGDLLPIPDEAPVIRACFLRPLGVFTAVSPLLLAQVYAR